MGTTQHKIILPSFNGYIIEELEQILFIKASGNYSILHFNDGRTHTVSKSIFKVEATMPETMFFRIHSSILVNLFWVKEVRKKQVKLHNGTELELAQRRKCQFVSKLKDLLVFLS